jgi:hypothetical protein
MRLVKRLAAALLALALVGACSNDSSPKAAAKVLWLCQPSDTTDACHEDLTSTAVGSDGKLTVQKPPKAQQPVDCFYVYPTVSQAQSTNAPLEVTDVERQTARAQVTRFSSVCKVWAPIYRQVTTKGLFSGKYGDPSARAIAHADVVSAWKAYLAANPGRRFVLIGHSQGTLELLKLVQEQIDPDPALRSRLVSALLIGGMVRVPKGAVVGGDLKHVPLCTKPRQTGCVVAYNAFAATPPAASLFGRADRAKHLVTACTNPAALGGGPAPLHPYLPAGRYTRPETTFAGMGRVTTPYATFPGYLTAECKSTSASSWLQVTVRSVRGDARPRALPTPLGPAWGLHVIDVNLALGDLVDLVRVQSR